jgi:hypothetical protein
MAANKPVEAGPSACDRGVIFFSGKGDAFV